ncbi:MAG: hypothetical protein ABJF89_00200 [Parasphingorhabdus sp.]|uniref:hypothetical protein n=1 Tax=Parasphingorhabdus sp. TaxID=2709688 RepID=UPI003263BDAE
MVIVVPLLVKTVLIQTKVEAALFAAGPTAAMTQMADEIMAAKAAAMLLEESENMMGVP